jgi:multiple sugar transport system substrate-binding protein
MTDKINMIPFDEVIGTRHLTQGRYLVTGEAGTGKTSLALQYALNAQIEEVTCLFISLKRKEARFQQLVPQAKKKAEAGAIIFEFYAYGQQVNPIDIAKQVKTFDPAYVVLDDIHVIAQSWTIKEIKEFLGWAAGFTKGLLITSLPVSQLKESADLVQRLADVSEALIELKFMPLQNQMQLWLWVPKHPGIIGSPGQFCRMSEQGVRTLKDTVTPSIPSRDDKSAKPVQSTSIMVMPEILYFSPLHYQRIKRRVEQYNRQRPGFSVRLPEKNITSILEYHQHIMQFEEGKSNLGLLPVDLFKLPELVEKELIHPLDDFFPESAQQAYIDKAIQQCRYRGKIYAVPHIINVGVMAYRQDLLGKIHRTPPTNWREMMECYRVLSRDMAPETIAGIGYQGAQFENLSCNLLELIWCNGGDVFDSSGHVTLNRPEAVEALQFLQDLIHKYHYAPPDTPFMMESHCERLFLEGRMVFMRSWPRIISQAELPTSHVSGRVGLMPLPIGFSGRESVPIIGAFGYVIPRTVTDPEPVWNFLVSMLTEEAMVESSTIGWSCPVIKDLYTHPDVLRARPYYRQMAQLIPTGRLRQNIPNYSVLTSLIKREAHLALRNEKNAQEAMDIISQELHKSIHRQLHIAPIQKAMEFVYEHLKDPITRDQVAKVVGISPSHFSVLFKDVTGQTFTDYLMRVRIEEARRLLGRPEYNISQISHEVGFNDESYFSFTFKRLTGVTPSHYRLNLQGTILSL